MSWLAVEGCAVTLVEILSDLNWALNISMADSQIVLGRALLGVNDSMLDCRRPMVRILSMMYF